MSARPSVPAGASEDFPQSMLDDIDAHLQSGGDIADLVYVDAGGGCYNRVRLDENSEGLMANRRAGCFMVVRGVNPKTGTATVQFFGPGRSGDA